MTTNNEQWIPIINLQLCTDCGDCIVGCPTDALGWQAGKVAVVNPAVCNYCAVCEEICPVGAIELPYLIVRADQKEHS